MTVIAFLLGGACGFISGVVCTLKMVRKHLKSTP